MPVSWVNEQSFSRWSPLENKLRMWSVLKTNPKLISVVQRLPNGSNRKRFEYIFQILKFVQNPPNMLKQVIFVLLIAVCTMHSGKWLFFWMIFHRKVILKMSITSFECKRRVFRKPITIIIRLLYNLHIGKFIYAFLKLK